MTPVQPISVAGLAKRFGKGTRWAAARMRQMRHTTVLGELFTTEEWLAEWLAAEAMPQLNWPPPGEHLDPLEEAVQSRVLQLVGALAREGKIQILAA